MVYKIGKALKVGRFQGFGLTFLVFLGQILRGSFFLFLLITRYLTPFAFNNRINSLKFSSSTIFPIVVLFTNFL